MRTPSEDSQASPSRSMVVTGGLSYSLAQMYPGQEIAAAVYGGRPEYMVAADNPTEEIGPGTMILLPVSSISFGTKMRRMLFLMANKIWPGERYCLHLMHDLFTKGRGIGVLAPEPGLHTLLLSFAEGRSPVMETLVNGQFTSAITPSRGIIFAMDLRGDEEEGNMVDFRPVPMLPEEVNNILIGTIEKDGKSEYSLSFINAQEEGVFFSLGSLLEA